MVTVYVSDGTVSPTVKIPELGSIVIPAELPAPSTVIDWMLKRGSVFPLVESRVPAVEVKVSNAVIDSVVASKVEPAIARTGLTRIVMTIEPEAPNWSVIVMVS